ncbi:hypothetical protein A0O36_02319 [Piscirickettsiaceae bacterium NZ-RLO1]|nr:hypothetical protein A0O36_02319 [Piscirickettsiaceae bacterium NZ-RLO1]
MAVTVHLWTVIDNKMAIYLVFIEVFGLDKMVLDGVVVETAGIEPASVNPPLSDLHA